MLNMQTDLVPRPTTLKNGVKAWIQTFCSHFLKVARSEEERQAILQEIEEDLAVVRAALFASRWLISIQDMLDTAGNWTCMYARLRFVAVRPN
jgi:hypothetical protein